MANTLQVKIRFRNAKTRMKDHKEHVKEAIEFAQCNLWQRFRIKISDVSFSDEYNYCDITLTCKEHDIHEFSNIPMRLKGVSAYLYKNYPEEYNQLKSGTRLFDYWVDEPIAQIKEERCMSAYMCSSVVLSIITEGIIKYAKDDKDLATEFNIVNNEADRKIIFEKLFQMNLDALIYRYGEETAESMYDKHEMGYYQTPLALRGDDIRRSYALYASLGKYLYQCNEGSIDVTFTYAVLSNMYDRVAHDIVKDTLAYDLMTTEISRW